MRSEIGMPDIPKSEHPEYASLKEVAREKVSTDIAELNIGLNLENHPKILDRLAETGSHFEDSLAMARIIKALHEPLKKSLGLSEEGPERIMQAAVLHDIGKSGPDGEETSMHDVVRRLFITPKKPFNPFAKDRPTTIKAFVEQQELKDSDEMLETLRKNEIDPDKEQAIDFWRRHANWGFDILNGEVGPDIDEDLAVIVGSHHILEGQNPAHLKTDELPTEAHVLETLELSGLMAAVDKYQAFRDRGHLNHTETMSRLRKVFENNQYLTDEIKDKFRIILDVLGESGQELEQYFENLS